MLLISPPSFHSLDLVLFVSSMNILTSKRGYDKIAYDGFIYRCDRYRDNYITWRCAKNNCLGRVETPLNYKELVGHHMVTLKKYHNIHKADHEFVEFQLKLSKEHQLLNGGERRLHKSLSLLAKVTDGNKSSSPVPSRPKPKSSSSSSSTNNAPTKRLRSVTRQVEKIVPPIKKTRPDPPEEQTEEPEQPVINPNPVTIEDHHHQQQQRNHHQLADNHRYVIICSGGGVAGYGSNPFGKTSILIDPRGGLCKCWWSRCMEDIMSKRYSFKCFHSIGQCLSGMIKWMRHACSLVC